MHPTYLALIGVMLLGACGPAGSPATPAPMPTAGTVGPETDVETVLAGLDVRDRIAQLVMPFIPGTYAAYDDAGFERTCSRLSLAAMSSGDPTETMTPPTWSESTHASARSNPASS